MTKQQHKNSMYQCSQCENKFSADDIIKYGEILVCFNCKLTFIQKIREGVPITPKSKPIRSKWWKIYFFFFACSTTIGYIDMLTDDSAGITEVIYFPIHTIGIIGLYGYAFSKKVFRRTFWLYFIAIYLSANIAYYFFTDLDLSAGMTPEMYLYVTIISWVIVLPAHFGVLLYGLPSNKLWINKLKNGVIH